jgi:dolichyl-phosphate beta-glucosyltransferase
VVIPAFNEEARLPLTIHTIRRHLDRDGMTWELIVVDDGSRDRTSRSAEDAAGHDERVKVLVQPCNRGKGPAIARGVAESQGELVLVTDADLSTPIDELEKLCRPIANGADVAIASRGKRASRIEVSQPIHRVLMGKAFNLLVQAAVLPGIWDTQCGFKLWRGRIAREVFAEMKLEGNVAFDVEVLFRARKRGYRIAEVPVRWIDSVPSRISPLRHSTEALFDIFKIRFLK